MDVAMVTYGIMDGAPTILIERGDGTMKGFEFIAGSWKSVHPIDLVHGARVLNQSEFSELRRRVQDFGPLPDVR